MFVLFNPVIDIVLILIIVYVFLYKIYEIYYKNKALKIIWIDFQVFIILAALFFVNYQGQKLDFFGFFEIHWLLYFLVMSIFIESFFFYFYRNKIGLDFKKINNNNQNNKNLEFLENEKRKNEYLLKKIYSLEEKDKTEKIKKEISQLKYKLLQIKKELDILKKENENEK